MARLTTSKVKAALPSVASAKGGPPETLDRVIYGLPGIASEVH